MNLNSLIIMTLSESQMKKKSTGLIGIEGGTAIEKP